jgi:tetratricopeptide (TPR) repeat protein
MVREIEGQSQQSNLDLSAKENWELEVQSNRSSANLTDADYEFLFGQLLEGVAYGWHQGRIVKFFEQLGTKGDPEGWVDWLGRFGRKLANIPDNSRRELATNTMRLGEIARLSPEVEAIGIAAYQVGRQLLFGNREDSIWEYTGPDLPLKLIVEPTLEIQSNTKSRAPAAETVDDVAKGKEEPIVSMDKTGYESGATSQAEDLNIEPMKDSELIETTKALFPQTTEGNTPRIDLASQEEDGELAALTWQQFISLIQQDEELVRQISQKLNISATEPDSLADAAIAKLNTLKPKEKTTSTSELLENWFNLGLKQASAGEFSSAIASWEKALELNPNLSEAWHNRGSALGRLGKYREAVESFEQALAIAPNNYQAWNDRAHALYQLQMWQDAVNSWDKAIAIAAGNHLFWYNRGCALEQLKKIEESILSYEKALEIKPDFQLARSRYISLVADTSQAN